MNAPESVDRPPTKWEIAIVFVFFACIFGLWMLAEP